MASESHTTFLLGWLSLLLLLFFNLLKELYSELKTNIKTYITSPLIAFCLHLTLAPLVPLSFLICSFTTLAPPIPWLLLFPE